MPSDAALAGNKRSVSLVHDRAPSAFPAGSIEMRTDFGGASAASQTGFSDINTRRSSAE